MSLSVTYQTKGTKQLEQALVQMGKRAGLNVLTGAMRDANRIHVKDARNKTPAKTGQLRKSIRATTFRGKGMKVSVATLQTGWQKSTGFYGQILERGAKPHTIPNKKIGRGRNRRNNDVAKNLKIGPNTYRKSVQHPGFPAKRILYKSFISKRKQIIQLLQRRLKQRIILEAIKKYGKSA